MKKKTIFIGIAGILLLGMIAVMIWQWHAERRRVSELESQVIELQQKEKRSAVIQNVSRQMEQIAYQQKAISDEEREEALRQKQEADAAKELAESQRHEADLQRQEADRQRMEAESQRQEADLQRQTAERERLQAEHAKRVADTLSYIALGRSLASVSMSQRRGGNQEIADLLAYASFVFTKRYAHNNANYLFNPTVLQSLVEASQSKHTWGAHHGTITDIDFRKGSDTQLASVSSYGEILRHEKQDGQLKTTRLFHNKEYDFRSLYFGSQGSILAVSRSGKLVSINRKIIEIDIQDITHPSSLVQYKGDTVIVAGDDGLAFIDVRNHIQFDSHKLNFKIKLVSLHHKTPVLFDDLGNMYELTNLHEIKRVNLPFKKNLSVTAYASTNDGRIRALGTSDGQIYVFDEYGKTKTLLGHRSRVSRLKFSGERLYSSSYDGTLNLWMYEAEKVEPMQLLSTGNWIMYFTNDSSMKFIWTGDQNGNLTETLISVPDMEEIIKQKLKRDLTSDEWNFYIGKDVPYESFVGGKEVRS